MSIDEMTCRELVEVVTDYLEGALSPSDGRRFEAHIAGCPPCALYLEQFRATIAAAGVLREEAVSAEARGALVARLAGWGAGR